jgi:ABC-type transport system involved in multi-copper enzyme maturation permease subunit
MTITTENQAVFLTHKWQGIASSIIGVTSIMITSLLVGIAMSGTEPPRPMITALGVLSSGMLCANLIGIALGFFGAKDRSSKKLYPLLGLTLNIAILMAFVAMALFELSMKAP